MSSSTTVLKARARAVLLGVGFVIFAACSGGDPTPSAPVPVQTPPPTPALPPEPEPIVGVQTPDSVAVVTATNAD